MAAISKSKEIGLTRCRAPASLVSGSVQVQGPQRTHFSYLASALPHPRPALPAASLLAVISPAPHGLPGLYVFRLLLSGTSSPSDSWLTLP